MEIILKNIMEDIVFRKLEELTNTMTCTCERCKIDAAAIALNQLKPQYVVSRYGELMAKANQLDSRNENNVMITTTIIKAIHIINESPRH